MKAWAADLIDRCKAAGLPSVGILDLDRANDVSPGFNDHFARYEAWVRAGHHGEMGYLERGLERRRDPRNLFPEARSILCLAIPYRRGLEPEALDGPRYARYIQGRDYHRKIPELLEGILAEWRGHWQGKLEDPKWKVCVDTSALLERSWASLAGLGWIGKNTLLIHPKLGSYLFLSFVLLNQESDQGPAPVKDYCGNCHRCLEKCPTQALEEPHLLNSRKCISYLTLEKRGKIEDEELRKKMGQWIAGCDLCQEVCPFNQKPARLPETWPLLSENEATAVRDWHALLSETQAEYKARTKNSSLERIKWRDWQRNLATALANLGPERRSFLELLEPEISRKAAESAAEPDLHFLWSRLSENSSA